MEVVRILLIVIAVYFFLVFVVLRLLVPFLGFGRFMMPENLPEEIKNAVQELEGRSLSQEDYLKSAYDLVIARWHAGRMVTIFKARSAFRKNLSTIWNSPGYAHCNTQNYILFVLLAGSRFFQAKDIEPRCVFFNFFIHQYLRVRINGEIVAADPAGASIRGKTLGEHIEFFG